MDKLQLKLLPEEHLILRELRLKKLVGRPMVVAVSGGVDSVLCYKILKRLQPITDGNLAVVHIHHGAGSVLQKRFRDQTQRFVEALCAEDQTPFMTNRVLGRGRALKNEKELREFRHKKIQEMLSKQPDSVLVFAHHRDDLIETQLMRLLRGTGAQGLQAMTVYNENNFRPLLFFDRKQILSMAKKLKLKWCEDPSNRATDPIRNWLRHQILPKIEKKMPGSLRALGRSLELISTRNSAVVSHPSLIQDNGIDRADFLALSREAQAKVLIQYFQKIDIWEYGQSHIAEILRRLDNGRVEFTFSMLQHTWRVNAEQINAVKK